MPLPKVPKRGMEEVTMNIVIKDTGKRGRGVFAVRQFVAGELIETCPVIVVPAEELHLINATVLYAYYFGWLEGGAFAHGYGSFYNHSDNPNAVYRKDYSQGTISFVCVHTIEPGEEITIRYNPGGEGAPLWFEPV